MRSPAARRALVAWGVAGIAWAILFALLGTLVGWYAACALLVIPVGIVMAITILCAAGWVETGHWRLP